MKNNEIRVRMAEYGIAKKSAVLVTLGLGSCVGVAIYDCINKIGGLIHIMLPKNRRRLKVAKYADTGIPYMIKEMEKQGARRINMDAKIAGGAMMFDIAEENSNMKIGEKNVQAVREVLKKEKIKIVGEDVGANFGRTVKFHITDGKVKVRSHKRGTIIL